MDGNLSNAVRELYSRFIVWRKTYARVYTNLHTSHPRIVSVLREFLSTLRCNVGNKNEAKNTVKKSLIFSFSRSFALWTNQSIRSWEKDEDSHNMAFERDANRRYIVLPLPGRLFMELICFLTQSTTDRNKSDSPPTGCDIAYTRPTAPGKITSFIANIK